MSKKEKIQEIRKQIEELRNQLGVKLTEISEIESSCQHGWSEPRRHYRKVDYDIGSYGGSYDEKYWERECAECGKVDRTYKVGWKEVPSFG